MRRLALLMAWLAFPVLLIAQGTQHNNYAQSIGPSNSIRAIPFATVSVCNGTTLPAAGTACSPLSSTIFTNPTLSIASPNPITADATANYNFWTAGGASYVISVAAPGFITYSYSWTAPLVTAPSITGSPIAGNVAVFSGATSITNGGGNIPFLASSAANPAAGGVLRLASGDTINWRNQANTGDIFVGKTPPTTGNVVNDTFYLSPPTTILQGLFASNTANNFALSGVLRLNSNDSIGWRNNANSSDLLLSKNTLDQLLYNSDQVVTATATQALTNKTLPVGDILPGTNGQCVNTAGGVAAWGSCAGTAGVQLIGLPNQTQAHVNAATTNVQTIPFAPCQTTPCYPAGIFGTIGKTFDAEFQGFLQFLNNSTTVKIGIAYLGTNPNAAVMAGAFPVTNSAVVSLFYIKYTCTILSTGLSGTMFCGAVVNYTDTNAGASYSYSANFQAFNVDTTNTLSPAVAVQFSTSSASNIATGAWGLTRQLN